jgi:hypothetical protein
MRCRSHSTESTIEPLPTQLLLTSVSETRGFESKSWMTEWGNSDARELSPVGAPAPRKASPH